MRHIHLDPLGGVAGDMFAAALLDAWPALGDDLLTDLRRAGLADDVAVRVERVTGEVLAGARFVVDDPRERSAPRPPHHAVLTHEAGHAHVPFPEIRARIAASGLDPGVVARAQDIFLLLAQAEAAVHGFADVDAVVFHEVGAMDSVADVVTAALLIERSGASSWSCGPVPLGSGTVQTAHGVLPVPAPATRALLEGLPVFDDGRGGERVTPTGAAILKHLAPARARPAGVLGACGTGWGTKRFPGLPNVLRAYAVETHAAATSVRRELVCAVSFEVDDQSGEDLAAGLDRIRDVAGVLDVTQAPVLGKKGRLASSVRVLARADAEDAAVRACLTETTTLGVRIERVERAVLAREEVVVDGVRTKRARRPDGSVSVKAEADDLAGTAGAAARATKRRRAEQP